MRKLNITKALLKSVAVGGIALAWVNLTLRSFEMAWLIISASPKEYTLNVVSIAVCEECQSRFPDDGNELCENCRKPDVGGENSTSPEENTLNAVCDECGYDIEERNGIFFV